ncbi:hypothetical protein WMY93_023496 [Mugilogobius chulae]|uniref:Uncharacterized protein n=1 Tax=Mugilogobius chulae TaxID=88201 RepID=A0AAW0NEY4_9GOBI
MILPTGLQYHPHPVRETPLTRTSAHLPFTHGAKAKQHFFLFRYKVLASVTSPGSDVLSPIAAPTLPHRTVSVSLLCALDPPALCIHAGGVSQLPPFRRRLPPCIQMTELSARHTHMHCGDIQQRPEPTLQTRRNTLYLW